MTRSSLFSVVSITFIVSLRSALSPDETNETDTLVKLLIYTLNSTAFDGRQPTLSQWNGPGATEIWIHVRQSQYQSHCCIGCRTGEAMAGALHPLWTWSDRLRQQRMNGLQTWYFSAVLEALPLLIQVSLLLFGIALGASIWTQQPTIATPVVLTMAFGALFCGTIVISLFADFSAGRMNTSHDLV